MATETPRPAEARGRGSWGGVISERGKLKGYRRRRAEIVADQPGTAEVLTKGSSLPPGGRDRQRRRFNPELTLPG